MADYSAAEILAQLDEHAGTFTFPMLDNGYVYLADVRLTAFRDDRRWAIVMEDVGFNPRGIGHGGVQTCLYKFGNCLKRKPGTSNDEFLFATDDAPGEPTFEGESLEEVSPRARYVLIRGERFPMPRKSTEYRAAGIKFSEPPKIMAFELLRALVVKHRLLFLATEKELRKFLPPKLPLFLQLDEWFHPDLVNDELPSTCPTFQMLAKAIELGDPKAYRPRRKPNTHWSHWPEGGLL